MANGGEFDRIERVLNNLKEGKPIGRDDFGLIRTAESEEMQVFIRKVAGYTAEGPRGKTFSTWLIARYGGGKTQALHQMRGMLGEDAYGTFKLFAPTVDLNHESARSPGGLQLTLFDSASALTPRDPATDTPEGKDELVSLGLEILKDVVGEVPGGNIVKNWLGAPATRQLYRRTPLLRRSVEKKLKNPAAVELMVRWMRYSLYPDNDELRRQFTAYQGELAQKGLLVGALAHVLKAARYSSMVILFDQAEKLVGNSALTDAIMNIYDDFVKVSDSPKSQADINLFFVFAGTGDVVGLDDDDGPHGGFVRRFRDPDQSSVVTIDLAQPVIDNSADNDIDRIKTVLQGLRRTYPGLPIPQLSAKRMRAIRSELARLEAEKGAVSWPMVWRTILGEQG